jgi:hypothetical protein
VGAAIDELVERLRKGNREDAVLAIDARVLPSVARVDDALVEILLLNREHAQSSAMRIAATTRPGGIVPELLGALFAVAASYFGVRVLVRYLAWAAERSAELEQFAGRVAHDIRSRRGCAAAQRHRPKDARPALKGDRHDSARREAHRRALGLRQRWWLHRPWGMGAATQHGQSHANHGSRPQFGDQGRATRARQLEMWPALRRR